MLIKLLIMGLLGVSAMSHADWQLDKSKSEISFIATKNASIADNHYFTDFDAHINDEGDAKLTIEMASVQTNIVKRNKRLRSILFEVEKFPQAFAELKVRHSYLQVKPAGTQEELDVAGYLTMLGIKQGTGARLQITHLVNNQVSVSTLEPILLDTSGYGMLPAINVLVELAGLKTIATKIPVSFNLVFEPVL